MRVRLVVVLAGLAVVIGACAPSEENDTSRGSEATPFRVDQVRPSRPEGVPSALDNPADSSFPQPLLDPDELRSGGPPPDGIPSIDDPRFLRTGDVGFLDDDEPVLALQVGREARAYPVQVLIWHEIVNDTVDGVPVTITYCPLCNSAVAYDRRLGDRVLEFGTSGQLFNSSLVMYDRQTESLWSHFTGQAVIGHLTGSQLEVFPVSTVSWDEWRSANPDGLVLSRKTGFDRDYGANPYPGYDEAGSAPFLFEGEVDGRLAAKERVVGIERQGDSVAVRLDRLAEQGVLDLDVGGTRLVAWVRAGTASALDDDSVGGGRDVGATGVFIPTVDGRQLSFARHQDGFVDDQTGTRWNVLGHAVDGPLAPARLEPVSHLDTFWFAWAAFQPETTVVP